jgi:hypothetical protein
MRALLFATAAVIALGGTAMANERRGGNNHHGGHGGGHNGPPRNPTVMDHYAAALGLNLAQVAGNSSRTGDGQANSVRMGSSFGGARGVFNVNQNAGANSGQQNAVAVAYVEGCDCTAGFTYGDGNANAIAGNAGSVDGNASQNGERDRGGYHHRGGRSDPTSATAVLDGSFGGATGVAQVNQNAGANSLQQNATAVAYAAGIEGTRRQTRDAWAIAGNAGEVVGSGNVSDDRNHNARGTISGSFGGFTGVANVNQNVGANSLQQNAAAISAIEFCECAANDLSTSIAVAANIGQVYDNRASATRGVAAVTMTGSFNGMQGIAQVNQNAGANSLSQNAVAVGAVFNR